MWRNGGLVEIVDAQVAAQLVERSDRSDPGVGALQPTDACAPMIVDDKVVGQRRADAAEVVIVQRVRDFDRRGGIPSAPLRA